MVVRVAFEEFDALAFQGGAEVVEGLVEEFGKEEEGRTLVEALGVLDVGL
jgi:hypothetical protein